MNIRPVVVAVTIASLLVATSAWAKVVGREVEYRAGETVLKGYLAEDTAVKKKKPGVLVVHEWWGLNDYARKRARMLAEQGYAALALDMFGDGRTANHPDDAGKFAGELMKNKALAESRFNAAVEFLKKQPRVDASRLAAIGYCFGGGVVLHMARQGAPLRGVASFHGTLATDAPAKPGAVKGKIIVFNGEADQMVPPEQVDVFKEEMDKAGASYRYVGYPGVRHSFTNPDADEYGKKFNLPLAYDRKADANSWAQTLTFLREVLKR